MILQSDDRVTLIFGPPGTGKTHTLIETVAQAIASGIEPERIAFLSFTRRAAKEAIERATEKFALDRNRFPYFRTLHSLAYKQLGLRKSEVMKTKDYQKLSKALGYEFSGYVDERTERVLNTNKIGDKLLSLYSLARAKGIPFEMEWEKGQYYDFPVYVAKQFCHNIEAYKAYNGLFDFSDFLDHCHDPLDVDLFILDEAQDLTPAEWDLAKRLARNCPKVVIAGDDDQAIYSWAGSDVTRFLGIKGKKIVLPLSYRVPSEIFSYVNSISSKIKTRYQKSWGVQNMGGSVDRFLNHAEDEINLEDKEWLLQCRHRSQVSKLVKLARQQGRTYTVDHDDITRSKLFKAVISYEALRSGKELHFKVIENIALFIRDFELKIPENRKYSYDQIPWPFGGSPDWMHALNLIGRDDLEYIRSCRRKGESLSAKPRVRITTIHGAKGAEADNVLLLTYMNKRVRQASVINPDDEYRVWYVGASRAKQKLILAGPDNFL